MDQKQTGLFIAALRKDKNLTQADLAQTLGVTDKSVSKWECGRCLPDASLMQPLCQTLGVSLSELFAGQRLDDEGRKEKAAEDTLLEIIKIYENLRQYKHVLFGLFLIIAGSFLNIGSSGEDASTFIQFVEGAFLGLSVGVKILGIVWTLYGFARAGQRS